MRFGCCVSTRDQIDILARSGYDFCELPAATVKPFEDDAAVAQQLRVLENAPLRAEAFNVLVPPQLPLAGPNVDYAALRAYLHRAFGRMVSLGAQVVVLGSGGARRIPDSVSREHGLRQLADCVAVALEEANHAGITVALEHLNRNETNVFNSVAEAQEFISKPGIDGTSPVDSGIRLLVDLYHIDMEHEVLEHVVTAGRLVAHAHVAGGGRRSPDIPGYDYAGFMHALHQIGYDQRISAECSWENLEQQARGALQFMQLMWAKE